MTEFPHEYSLRKSFVIVHWASTLLISPVMSQMLISVFSSSPHQIVSLLEIYPVTLLFSIVFSLPTLIVCLISFYFLKKKEVNPAVSKLILISLSVFGIYITQTLIQGSMSQDIIIAYSLTASLVGIMLKIKEVG